MIKLLTIVLLLTLPAWAMAQSKTWYVAHKAGLSIRDKADVKGKVLDKIPYGTKISLPTGSESTDTVSVTTDGMTGFFRKVTYNGKTGYIIDCYLFEIVPPKANVKNLRDYLAQLSPKFGAELVVKSGTMQQITESGYEQKKQLYKNGAGYQTFMAYEYGSETCIIPGMNIQQAYLLLRLMQQMREFKDVITEKDEFPTTDKKYTKAGLEYEVKVQRVPTVLITAYGVEKIRIEYSDGGYYFIEISRHENDAVIHWGGGV